MYTPPAFEEKDPEMLLGFIHSAPLGLLVSQGETGIVANLLPFEIRMDGEKVSLCAHLARANRQWHNLAEQDVLVVFQGANAYVSPQWYESKREHGRVVPTWNYAMVQARGRVQVIEDKQWLKEQVTRLTDRHEQGIGQDKGWQVTDAPEDFIQSQLKGIVGLEIVVTQLTGKLKASQNRSAPDRAGVVAGLTVLGGDQNREMANLVERPKI